jgi:hypothetical protein
MEWQATTVNSEAVDMGENRKLVYKTTLWIFRRFEEGIG